MACFANQHNEHKHRDQYVGHTSVLFRAIVQF